MKISFVNDGFDMGGVERVTIKIANSLQENGHQVSLIDFSGKNHYYYDINKDIKIRNVISERVLKRKLIRKALLYKYRISNKQNSIYYLYKEQIDQLIKFVKENRPDILVVCQGILTAAIPWVKREIKDTKIIAWQHNDFDVYVNDYYKEFVDDYLFGVKQADKVICLTNADIRKFKSFNNNSCNIYNPLTISEEKLSNLESKYIVFVGRLKIEQKGLDYLIPIGKSLGKDWKIVVAGDGPDREKFQKLISDNNLQDKFILKGSVSSEELVDIYSSGSIFISTSRWEGFGLVITEAMACGLPIISFKNLGPNEILNQGKYGILIENYDVQEFVVNLKELMVNPEKRKYLQGKSLERVTDFKIEKILQDWSDLIWKLTQPNKQ
ncbi:glycosyltransferase family 4 protein [Niallia taxi]|uniref:glycosyltransferase family 4 protein n=1 Tax=Niallia taxi TaxID=2499688 RepID=UPI003D287638